MGRKKKRNKPLLFCYYCERIFDNERVLIQHQRAKHFKCPQCRKTMSTAHGMMVHVFQVHKDTIDSVPGAKEGRSSFDMEIYGMDGVPAEIIEQKRIKIYGEAAAKKPRIEEPKMPSPYNQFGAMGVPNPAQWMMQMPPQIPLYPGMSHPAIPQGIMPMPMQVPMPMPTTMMPLLPPPMVSTEALPTLSASPNSAQALLIDSRHPSPLPGLPQVPIPAPRYLQAAPPRNGVQGGQSHSTLKAEQLPVSWPGSQQSMSPPTGEMKNLSMVLIFDNENASQEEIRAMHPKYYGHVTNKITSLSASIEARLQSLQ